MATEIIESTESTSTVADLIEQFRRKVEHLDKAGKLPKNTNLTHFAMRLESEDGRQVEWVNDDGRKFVTKSNSREFERPHAPFIPSAVKKLLTEQNEKAVNKAKESVNKALLGCFALMESRLYTERAPRTLPGIAGYQYSTDAEIREYQKFAHAGEKIGL